MNDAGQSQDERRVPLADRLWFFSGAIAAALIGISAFVMIFTFPMRISHTILIKPLVRIFGVEFAIAFIAAQVVLLVLMKSYRGLALAAGLFGVGMLLGWIGMTQPLGYGDVATPGFTAGRHILAAGVCVSGLAVGIALVKGWLRKPARD